MASYWTDLEHRTTPPSFKSNGGHFRRRPSALEQRPYARPFSEGKMRAEGVDHSSLVVDDELQLKSLVVAHIIGVARSAR